MNAWRNLAAGFAISFIGSVPLGYLNVIGFEIFSAHGYGRLLAYIGGVIAEEAIVIYLTLAFAEKLARRGRWVKAIELLSILFLIALAVYFFVRNQDPATETPEYVSYSPFAAGAILNAANFMQLPFWTGWNLYLMQNKWIAVGGKLKFLYIFGALAGTVAGMLAFILGLHYLAENIDGLSHYLMKYLIPGIFLGLAGWQAYKFFKAK